LIIAVAGSDEEKEDLKKAYLEAKGDMDRIIDNVLCASVEDEARFRTIIEGWIDDNTVKPFTAFTHENKKKREERKRKVRLLIFMLSTCRSPRAVSLCFDLVHCSVENCFT
jgi:hypothetical protein